MSASASDKEHTDDVFWEEFWAEGVTVGEYFDKGYPLPELVKQLTAGTLLRGGRALVPGCGRGYDVEALVNSGLYDSVVGLEISQTAAAAANKYLSGRKLHGDYGVVVGDFCSEKTLAPGFTLVYDYAFFCAISVENRPKWAERMKELVHIGGVLVTVMYPMGKAREEGGPPHGVCESDYAELLEGGGGFTMKDGPRVIPDEECHENRLGGKTWWAVWERT